MTLKDEDVKNLLTKQKMKIFISFPYSHDDTKTTLERVRKAREYCVQLLQEGHIIFCPAVFGHDLIVLSSLDEKEQDLTFKKWEEFCYAYLEPCDEFHVLQLEGYEKSIGVGGEMLKARLLNKTIRFIEWKE